MVEIKEKGLKKVLDKMAKERYGFKNWKQCQNHWEKAGLNWLDSALDAQFIFNKINKVPVSLQIDKELKKNKLVEKMSERLDVSEYSAELFGLGGKPTKKELKAILEKIKQAKKQGGGKGK